MSRNKTLSVVIPAYNEENGITGVIEKIHEALAVVEGLTYEIVVVDDGSTDETSARASVANSHVITHPKNCGYGRSLLTGIDHASHDLIAIIDADGTYDPRDLTRMLPLMNIYDMVVGSRSLKNQTVFVSLLRFLLKGIIFFFTGRRSYDPNSGLRIFTKEMVQQGKHLFSQKFSFSTSLTVYASLTHRFIEYLPIPYYERTGLSKVRHIRDSLRTFFLILSMALVFRPGKCFLAQTVVCVVGLFLLFWGKSFIGFEHCIEFTTIWLSANLLTSLGFISHLLSCLYDQASRQR
ncbi:MAG: glycosyltransferase family 2 protein [Candidatus Ozemobacteraceae bacterium]